MKKSIVSRTLGVLFSFVFALTLFPKPAQAADVPPKATIILTFDDGWKDTRTNAYPILQSYGFKATVYVNSEAVDWGDDTIMTLADMQFLYANGWDISNHTHSHTELGLSTTQANLEKLKQEYITCRDWLIANGMPNGAAQVAYPSGKDTMELHRMLKSIGVQTGRDVEFGLQQTPITSQNDYFRLPVYSTGPGDLSSDLAGIEDAAAQGKTIIFMVHQVEPLPSNDPDALITLESDLVAICELIKSKGAQAQVMTMSQWYAAQDQSALVPATPAAPAVINNDFTNTVSGINLNMEYKLDGAADYTKYNAATFNAIGLSGNHTLLVRYSAFGIDNPSPDKVLTFTQGQDATLAVPDLVQAVPLAYNKIKVSWGAVAGAAKYEVWRSKSPTGTFSLLSTTAYTYFTNTGIATGTPFYYKVRAFGPISGVRVYSGYSAIVVAQTALNVPAAVQALRISATSIKVKWGAVAGANGYEIWRAASLTDAYSVIKTTSNLYYTNAGLTTGTTYFYKVRAYRLVGSTKVYSEFSAVVNAKP